MPDGYTLTLAHQGALTINPHLYSKPGYDTLRKRITSLGQTPVTSSPEEFDGWIRSEFERWGKVVKASGAKAD